MNDIIMRFSKNVIKIWERILIKLPSKILLEIPKNVVLILIDMLENPWNIKKLPKHIINIPIFVISEILEGYFSVREPAGQSYKDQQNILFDKIKKSKKTVFAKEFWFSDIKSVRDFQKNIPIFHYKDYENWVHYMLKWEKDISYPGKIDWFATSSGTTWDNKKYIPITKENFYETHVKASKEIINRYYKNNKNTKLFTGKYIVLWWTMEKNPYTNQNNVGYMTAIFQNNEPQITQIIRRPTNDITYLSDWEDKINKTVKQTIKEDIISITWQPSWCLDFFNRVLKYTGKNNIFDVWPNFEVFFWWWMSMDLYWDEYKKIFPGDQMKYYQTYSSSEGFFAVQNKNNSEDMYLLTNNGVFYEFILRDDYNKWNMKAITINDIEIWKKYVFVITNNSWLRRYVIGDTIEFTSINPRKIKINGRTKYYIDVASERTTVEYTDKAIFETSKETDSTVLDYTVGPYYDDKENKFWHERIIESIKKPKDLKNFILLLDDNLSKANSYYYEERTSTKSLLLPKVKFVEQWTFYSWLKSKNKLGGQYKIPKLSNDRKIIEELLKIISN